MVRYILILFILTFNSYAQEFGVRAYTDTNEYLIGDHIKLNYVVEHDEGISFGEPSFRDNITNIDFIGAGRVSVKEEEGRIITVYEVLLSRYDSSDISIAPITFYYWRGKPEDKAVFLMDKYNPDDTSVFRAYSNEVNFSVRALKVNIEEDIKDIKEPMKIPPDWKLIMIYILIGLLVIAAAVYIYMRIRKKRLSIVKPKVILPPHIAALSSLGELEKKNLWQKGLIKEFHSEITGIIRKYFEERFNLPALELTTSETLTLINADSEGRKIADDTEIFLNNADLVKFAKFIPLGELNEMMMKKAYSIVEQTIPAAEPVQEEAADVQ
jgi:hypothetical protein